MSELLDAPAILCGTSRLVIDCNRQLDHSALIPVVSDGTPVPGNASLSEASRTARIERWFQPYHDTIESVLIEREARGIESIVVAIHSMAPSLNGKSRPWQIALSSETDRRLMDPLLAALQAEGELVVGDNEPLSIEPLVDYSIPFHAARRGLLHVQVEFRQDEVADDEAQHRWASLFAAVLDGCVDAGMRDCRKLSAKMTPGNQPGAEKPPTTWGRVNGRGRTGSLPGPSTQSSAAAYTRFYKATEQPIERFRVRGNALLAIACCSRRSASTRSRRDAFQAG